MSVGVTAVTVTLLNTSFPTLSAGNFSSAQTFSAMSNSPSARYVPKRMFRLCSLNKYLSSAAAETALTRQNHRPVESAGRSFFNRDKAWLPEWSIMPARNKPTCPAVVPLCGTKAEVTVPSLDDWEKDWQENPQRSMQPKLLPVDFRPRLTAISQAN
jgi:hypothetical protein